MSDHGLTVQTLTSHSTHYGHLGYRTCLSRQLIGLVLTTKEQSNDTQKYKITNYVTNKLGLVKKQKTLKKNYKSQSTG